VANLDRANAILAKLPDNVKLTGVEVGVWAGETTRHLLRKRKMLELVLVDPWAAMPEPMRLTCSMGALCVSQEQMDNVYNKVIDSLSFAKDRIDVMRMELCDAANKIASESQDFVFLDADHTKLGTLCAMLLYWPKVKAGGWLCGHDLDHVYEVWGVRPAVEWFCAQRKLKFQKGAGATWFIRKPESNK